MYKMRGAYLLPEFVHAPLGQLLPYFDRRLLYGLWCWLGILKVSGLAGCTHSVSVRGKQKTLLVQEGIRYLKTPRLLREIDAVEVEVKAAEGESELRRAPPFMHSSRLPPMLGDIEINKHQKLLHVSGLKPKG